MVFPQVVVAFPEKCHYQTPARNPLSPETYFAHNYFLAKHPNKTVHYF